MSSLTSSDGAVATGNSLAGSRLPAVHAAGVIERLQTAAMPKPEPDSRRTGSEGERQHGDSRCEPPAMAAAADRPGNAASFAPAETATYLDPSYWDARFEQEESYEWCKDYGQFRHLVAPHLQPDDRILELGCGNSSMAAALAAEGQRHITCTDLSATVVRRMQARADAAGQAIHYQVADMMQLPFEDASFDVCLEKGAIDVFFTDSSSPWEPPPEVRQRVAKALGEAHRVLRPQGTFISITFAQPHFRTPLILADPGHTWSVDVQRFGEAFHYYVFVCKKGGRAAGGSGSGEATAQLQMGPPVRSRTAEDEGPMHEHMDGEGFLTHMCL